MTTVLLLATAAAPRPTFSTLFTSQDVQTYLANATSTAVAVGWAQRMGLSKIYLETYRAGGGGGTGPHPSPPPAMLRAAAAAFEAAGIRTAGCVCTTGIGVPSTEYPTVSNYAMRETQQATAEIFASAARIFDELIIDDFFFTTDASAASNASLASRTVTLYPTNYTNGTAVVPFTVGSDASCTGADGCAWSWQRRAMMHGVAQRDVLAAATAANPNVTVTLKFPNWYDHYQDHGYDVGATAELFPATWVGTETRDYDASSWGPGCSWSGDMPVTLGNFNLRWHSSVRSGGATALGSWYDSLCTGPASYVEQARQAVVAGSPEQFLFHYGDLVQGSGAADAAALRRAMPDLVAAHAALAGLAPVGVVAYKPINSHGGCKAGGAAPRDKPCDGEAHVFDFVAALGVPLLPTAAWPPSGGDGALPAAAFFSVHSLKDPATPQHLREAEAAGVELLLTDGLLALLPPPLAAALRRSPTVHVLAVGGAPKQLLAAPPPGLRATRDALLRRLGLALEAPESWVAFYPYVGGAWALMNLANASAAFTVRELGGARREWNGTIEGRGWARGFSN